MLLQRKVHADCLAIYQLLTRLGETSAATIRASLSMTEKRAENRLAKARELGWIANTGKGATSRWFAVEGIDTGLPGVQPGKMLRVDQAAPEAPAVVRAVLHRLKGRLPTSTADVARLVCMSQGVLLPFLAELRRDGRLHSAVRRRDDGSPYAIWWLPEDGAAA